MVEDMYKNCKHKHLEIHQNEICNIPDSYCDDYNSERID